MKFTVAATALVSSLSATAESIADSVSNSLNVVAETTRGRHRSLAEAIQSQEEITSIFKERRGLKREKGGTIRRIQSELRRRSLELRNQDSDVSYADDALDLGVFSRHLQSNATNSTTPTKDDGELSIVDELLQLCEKGNPEYGLTCECSNVNADSYEIDVFCTYGEAECYLAENSCGTNETFCYTETYELEVKSPGEGTSKICYDVSSPIEFSYCYTLIYGGERVAASGCAFEFNGNQCNSCEFVGSECAYYDCSNVDGSVGVGSVCGNKTVWRAKVRDHLFYAPLPCEDGCKLCPGDGDMTYLSADITMPTGEIYNCSQLDLAGQLGYFQYVPGDLCNALPPIVSEPCGCTGGAIPSGSGDKPSSGGGSSAAGKENKDSTAATFSPTGGLALTAVAASFLSWVMA